VLASPSQPTIVGYVVATKSPHSKGPTTFCPQARIHNTMVKDKFDQNEDINYDLMHGRTCRPATRNMLN
jgi:hypothetical protein